MSVLQDIALAIKAVGDTVAGLTTYPHETFAHGLRLPALTIGAVDIDRTEPLRPEIQLGTRDWDLTWALTLYVALDDPAVAYPAARDLLTLLISAFDSAETLGGLVEDGKVTRAESGVNDADANRRLIVVEMDFECLALMPI